MIDSFPILSDLQKDALKEVGNIGAGHAATALSQLLNSPITLSQPTFDLVPFSTVAANFDATQQVAALRMQIRGGVPGQMLVFFDKEQAQSFAKTFLHRIIGDIQIFESMTESTLKEFANIVGGAYITAIIGLTGLDMIPSVPSLQYGTAGDALASFKDLNPDSPVILIQNHFGSDGQDVFGRVVLIPEGNAIASLLEPFGV